MLRVACRTLSQPGAGLARTCAVSSRVGAQPGRPEVEGHRRQRVDDHQQRDRVGLAAVGQPEPRLDDRRCRSAGRPPSRRGRGGSACRSGSISGAISRISVGRHRVRRRTRPSGGSSGSSAVVRTSSPQPVEVAVRRERGDPGWRRSCTQVGGDAWRRCRRRGSTSTRTSAGPGVAAEVVGADGDRVRLAPARARAQDRVADHGEQVAAVDPAADHPAGRRGRRRTSRRRWGRPRCRGRTRGPCRDPRGSARCLPR